MHKTARCSSRCPFSMSTQMDIRHCFLLCTPALLKRIHVGVRIRHAVEVTASSLYEAAALAIGEFRRCGFTADAPGPATRLTVAVQAPATSHEVPVRKIETWLQSGGRSPNEQALKARLKELLGS